MVRPGQNVTCKQVLVRKFAVALSVPSAMRGIQRLIFADPGGLTSKEIRDRFANYPSEASHSEKAGVSEPPF